MSTVAMSRLPSALAQEIEDLGHFEVRHTRVADQVILTAEVRGVPVALYLDTDTYPAQPPRLEIAREWTRGRRGRPIHGLASQEQWNRTLGLGALLRELEQRFVDEPPKRPSRRRGGLLRAARAFFDWLKGLFRRLFGRRDTAEVAPTMPAALRARYREVIDEKSGRIDRYQQAVAQLVTQWQRKTANLEELGEEIQQQERAERDKLAEAERLVDRLKAAGQTLEQIKGDTRYQRCLAAYESLAADLEEQREGFSELEADAEEHLVKIQHHKSQLEELVSELEELEQESAEVAADLATVQVEKEIVDLQAGISRTDSDHELQKLLRQFRKAKAAVRVTREAADLDAGAGDDQYLDVARKVSAAKRFEASVGLGEAADLAPPDRVAERPARE